MLRSCTLGYFCVGASQFHIRFLANLFEQCGFALWINNLVHCFETLERIFAIEDSRIVEVTAFGLEDASSKATVGRRASDGHRDFMSAAMKFVDDQRHLLGCGYEQRG